LTIYFHGGAPGLAIGALLEPGHSRDHRHPGCPWCEARARGDAHLGADGPSHRPDRVYMTEDREYARYHASLYGRGDLYLVEPVGEVEPSDEDSFPTATAPAARVVAVLARSVLLSMPQRRRIAERWAMREGVTRRQARAEFHEMIRGAARRAGAEQEG
jgi:hypothetical protein